MAKEKKQEGKMDMQAMMDLYKKLATPGAPHRLLANMGGSWKSYRRILNGGKSNLERIISETRTCP